MSGLEKLPPKAFTHPTDGAASRIRDEATTIPAKLTDALALAPAGETRSPATFAHPSPTPPGHSFWKPGADAHRVAAPSMEDVPAALHDRMLVAGVKLAPIANSIDAARLRELTRIVVSETELVFTVFDAEFDDFLALGSPDVKRQILVTGARPEYVAQELSDRGHQTLACAPIVMGSQAAALGGVDSLLRPDAELTEVDARVDALLRNLVPLASAAADKTTRIDSGSNSTLATAMVLLMQHGERAQPAVRALLTHDALLQCNKANPQKWRSLVDTAESNFLFTVAELAQSPAPTIPVAVIASSLVKKTSDASEPYELGGANFDSNPVASMALLRIDVDVILSHRTCSGPISELTLASLAVEIARTQSGTEAHTLWTDVQRLFNQFLASQGPVASRSKAFNVPQLLRWCTKAAASPDEFKRWEALRILLQALRDNDGQLSVDQVLVGDASMTALARTQGQLSLQPMGEHVFVQCPEQREGDDGRAGLIAMLSSIAQGLEAIATYDAASTSNVRVVMPGAPSKQEVVAGIEGLVTALSERSYTLSPSAEETLRAANVALRLLEF